MKRLNRLDHHQIAIALRHDNPAAALSLTDRHTGTSQSHRVPYPRSPDDALDWREPHK
jgi:hypothetical protein